MKKKIAIILALLLTSTLSINAKQFKGDINKDGEITVLDIVELSNIIMNCKQLTEEDMVLTDVNGDGKISVADIVTISTIILDNRPVDQPKPTATTETKPAPEAPAPKPAKTPEQIAEEEAYLKAYREESARKQAEQEARLAAEAEAARKHNESLGLFERTTEENMAIADQACSITITSDGVEHRTGNCN